MTGNTCRSFHSHPVSQHHDSAGRARNPGRGGNMSLLILSIAMAIAVSVEETVTVIIERIKRPKLVQRPTQYKFN